MSDVLHYHLVPEPHESKSKLDKGHKEAAFARRRQ